MTIVDRLGVALKAATRLVFPQGGPWSRWAWGGSQTYRYGTGGGTVDYGAATDGGRGSSIVQACVLWMCRTFPEAPPRVQRRTADGVLETLPDHPLFKLLTRPNPYYSGSLLWWGTIADWMFGNAYWFKVRSAAGIPVEYWWIPAQLIEPRWPEDGSEFISHYEYRPGGGEPIRLARSDVAHYRYGLDPLNPRKGLSPLGSLLRELFTDEEAAGYVASMLKNMGVPGVVIAPMGDNSLTETDATAVKQAYMSKFSGDRRGEPLVLSNGAQVTAFGFSPEQMTVRELRRIPEERVTAILGTAAVVVGLGAGLDRSTYANMREARESTVESSLVPAWRMFAEEMETQLLPDFANPRLSVDFDLSKVRVLQDDQDNLHARARNDLAAGLVTLNEARRMIGQDATDTSGDVYYLPAATRPVDPSDLLTPAVANPGASGGMVALPGGRQAAGLEGGGGRKAVERVGPFPYEADPLPAMVYDAAERRKLARAWDTVFEGLPEAGMLDAEAVNGNGTH